MRSRVVPVLAAALAGACADERTGADGPPMCGVKVPTLLAPAPQIPGLEDEMYLVGDWISFRFGDDPMQSRRRFVPRCGGEVQTFAAPAGSTQRVLYASFADEPYVYSFDQQTRRLLLLDRLAQPGIDAPADLGVVPGADAVDFASAGGAFVVTARALDPARPYAAAGVGAPTSAVWTHDGDRDDPLVPLGEFVDTAIAGPAGEFWSLDDAGELRRRDLAAGTDILVADLVRAAHPVAGDRVIWQARTDDIAEPVYLRDLETDTDIALTINEFTPIAWGRDPTVSRLTGTWATTHDGAHLVLIGPDERYVRAYRGDTGEAVPVPAHVGRGSYFRDGFWLRLADEDPSLQVDAWWAPGHDPIVWRRGAANEHLSLIHGGETIEWIDHRPVVIDGAPQWLLYTFDPNTDETRLVADVGPNFARVDPDRLLVTRLDPWTYGRQSLVLLDLVRDSSTVLVEQVGTNWQYVAGEGVYYVDRTALAAAGVWVTPIAAKP